MVRSFSLTLHAFWASNNLFNPSFSSTGEFDEETGTLFHGAGSAILDNGCTYEGSFKNGLFHGKGKFAWTDNVTFEGMPVFSPIPIPIL